jgi:hypothetical protein
MNRWIVVVLAALIILVSAYEWTRATHEEVYTQFVSPTGDYKIVVFRTASPWARMPGQAGDAPGRVVLLDRSGHRLREAPVEMVQLVEGVLWEPSGVSIRNVGQWQFEAGRE